MTAGPAGPAPPGPLRALLRLEGAAALAVAAAVYARTGAGWPLFAALLLAPDLSALGYLHGLRAGAAAYNAAHTYLAPALLAGAGALVEGSLLPLALIWAAHIGMDRMLGYGLKAPGSFTDTHLGPIGRARKG